MSIILGTKVDNCEVVFIKGDYYVTSMSRPMDDQKLYRVFKDGESWHGKLTVKFMSVYLDSCIDWINKRRIFKGGK